MPTITDNTYYQQGIKFIPNTKTSGTPVAGVPTNDTIEELNYFIEQNERVLLLYFLSVELYEELIIALDDLDNALDKWKNLVNGVTYTYENEKYIFNGLRGYNKNSLVANYVFCKYLENDESYYSTDGVVVTKSKKEQGYDPSRKYIDNYNAFLNSYQNDLYNDIPTYYYSNGILVGVDYYNDKKSNNVVTLETFLKHNNSDYEGYEFTRFETKNSFGI